MIFTVITQLFQKPLYSIVMSLVAAHWSTFIWYSRVQRKILTLICFCFCSCCNKLATVCRDLMSLAGTELSVSSAFSRSNSEHMLLRIAVQSQPYLSRLSIPNDVHFAKKIISSLNLTRTLIKHTIWYTFIRPAAKYNVKKICKKLPEVMSSISFNFCLAGQFLCTYSS